VHTCYSLVGAQTGRLSRPIPTCRTSRSAPPSAGASARRSCPSGHDAALGRLLADRAAPRRAHGRRAAAQGGVHRRRGHPRAHRAWRCSARSTATPAARAKTVNFAILYGISRWGLGGRLGIEADEAQAIIDSYFERFPGIQRYIVHTLESVRERGYSETLFGRKTWFPRINAKIPHERQGAERAAINAPIQGTSADIIKRAMARMPAALADAGSAT
jgi:DNA polymerase-1